MKDPFVRYRVGETIVHFPTSSLPDYALRPNRNRVQHCMDTLRTHTFKNDLPAHNHFLHEDNTWTLWGQGMTQEEALTLCGEPHFYNLERLQEEQ